MVQESQRSGRFEHPAARQFHTITGIIGLHRENLALNLPQHHAGLELPPGEHPAADVGLVHPHELAETFVSLPTGFSWRAGPRFYRLVWQKLCILMETHGLDGYGVS